MAPVPVLERREVVVRYYRCTGTAEFSSDGSALLHELSTLLTYGTVAHGLLRLFSGLLQHLVQEKIPELDGCVYLRRPNSQYRGVPWNEWKDSETVFYLIYVSKASGLSMRVGGRIARLDLSDQTIAFNTTIFEYSNEMNDREGQVIPYLRHVFETLGWDVKTVTPQDELVTAQQH